MLPLSQMLFASLRARLGPFFVLSLMLLDAGRLRDAALDDTRLADDHFPLEVNLPRGSLEEIHFAFPIPQGLDDAREVEIPRRRIRQQGREDEI